ncbi:MAG TPA: serine acetyltransferase [Myxococcaceae bacterium]|nr:serine acetyltransferase [Myxococcaceae bacterium]
MGVDAMTFYWLARRVRSLGVPLVPSLLRKASYYLHSSYIPEDADIGYGTQVGYGGLGIVIHKEAKVGRHCLLSQQVTIGGRSGRPGAPVICDFVRIGAGAKVLGAVRVGKFAVIGANAVVVKDVRDGAVVAGVPAVELRVDPNPSESYLRELGAHVSEQLKEDLDEELRRESGEASDSADLVH